MASIIDTLMQHVSDGALNQLSKEIGADPQKTQGAFTAGVPLLVSALTHQASQPQSAQALHQTLTQKHDGSVLDNTQQVAKDPSTAGGSNVLDSILGSMRDPAQQQLAQHTGLNSSQISRVLEFAAPLVMGYLGKQVLQRNLDPQGLQNMLQNQQQQTQGNLPSGLGGLVSGLMGGQGGGKPGGGLGNLFGGQ
jgi:hypothetical protein